MMNSQLVILVLGLMFFSFMAFMGLFRPGWWVRTSGSAEQKRRIKQFALDHDPELGRRARVFGALALLSVAACLYGIYSAVFPG